MAGAYPAGGAAQAGSYVVTGGRRGLGRAVAERLLAGGGAVVLIEPDPAAVAWTGDHPAAGRLRVGRYEEYLSQHGTALAAIRPRRLPRMDRGGLPGRPPP